MHRLTWLLPALATTLVVVAWSETMYYPATAAPWAIGVWYLPAVVLALHLLADRRGWAEVALAGWVVGASVEGSIVAVLYEALPVSIANPALGWHMLVSVLIGTLGLGAALRATRWWVVPGVVTVLGVLLGLWWPLWLLDGPLDAGAVGGAVALGASAAAAGHAVLLVTPRASPPRAVGVLCAAFVTAGVLAQATVFPWAPLVLAVVVGPPIWLLLRGRGRVPVTAAPTAGGAERVRRVGWFALMPLVAAGTFALAVDTLGARAAADLASMLAVAQVVAGTVVAVVAVVVVRRRAAVRVSVSGSQADAPGDVSRSTPPGAAGPPDAGHPG